MKGEIKQHVKAGRLGEVAGLLMRVRPSDPLDLLEYAAAQLEKLPAEIREGSGRTRKRLAILGGATTQFLTPLIRLFAWCRGVSLEIYESGYGLFEQEIWSESPELRAFAPDVIHFHLTSHNLSFAHHADDPDRLVKREAARFLGLYQAARERFGAVLVVNNFDTAAERPYGTLDAMSLGSRNSMIRSLNEAIGRSLPAQVYLHDIEQLSSICGKARWSDAKLWNEAKAAVSFDCQPFYADRLAGTLAALFGKSKKCLVLDLDNTLWGGVIGDDGLGGIRLGAGNPEGEAFARFQSYVKTLKDRGVLLGVASKNEIENARAPFREHPDMVLKETDVACFVANWEPKDESLRQIAGRLNIGRDALVFFDDNPAERQLIRDRLPEVTVVEVPSDPSLFVQALDELNLFDTLSVTREDQVRAEFFQQNEGREQLESAASNYDDFLKQLEMRASIEPINETNLSRVVQLINKTNQFNLTTVRMTEADVRALLQRPTTYTSTIRLDDKFGSNGLISVVVGETEGETLTLKLWLMSCRVLKRGVEELEMERIVDFCRRQQLGRIVGLYRPTEKNKLVHDHYPKLGFKEIAGDPEGTTWSLNLAGEPETRNHCIEIVRDP